MPVRSLNSAVFKWPDRETLLSAARQWAVALKDRDPLVAQIGCIGSYARGDWGVGSDLDVIVVLTDSDLSPADRYKQYYPDDLPVPADLWVHTKPSGIPWPLDPGNSGTESSANGWNFAAARKLGLRFLMRLLDEWPASLSAVPACLRATHSQAQAGRRAGELCWLSVRLSAIPMNRDRLGGPARRDCTLDPEP